jgi:hypothetical protein
MMELAALVSALGVNLHRTKRGRRRTGFNGHGGPLGAWLLLFNNSLFYVSDYNSE